MGGSHLKASVREELLPGFLRWLLAALLSSLGAEQSSLLCGLLYIEGLTTRQEDVNKMEDRVLWYPNFGSSINQCCCSLFVRSTLHRSSHLQGHEIGHEYQ